MRLLMLALLFFVPIVIGSRVRKAGAFVLYNPLLYLVIFSYFYLLVPSLLPADSPISEFLGLGKDSFDRVGLFSCWFLIVFLGAYGISSDYRVELRVEFSAPKVTISISTLLLFLTVCFSIYILYAHGAALYGLSSSRFDSYEYYKYNILIPYAYQLVFQFAFICVSLLALNYRSGKVFLLLTPFLMLDFLQGGRAYTFMVLISFCLVGVLVYPNGGRKILSMISLSVLILFLSAFFRRALPDSEGLEMGAKLIEMFGEFYYTRLTAEYVHAYSLGAGGFFEFIVLVFSKLFPQFIVSAFTDVGTVVRYDVELNESVDVGFGLAGSILAEAFYYGGEWFSWLAPFLIAAVYYALHRLRIICTLPGFVFFLLLVGSSFSIFRSAFFLSFTALVYTFFFYFSFVVLTAWHVRLLKVTRVVRKS